MNNVQPGLQIAKQAVMEVNAASEASSALSSMSYLYDACLDGRAKYVDRSMKTMGIDIGIISRSSPAEPQQSERPDGPR